MYKLLTLFLTPETVGQSLIIIIVCALVGIVIYGYLGFKTRLIDILFGDKVEKVKQKLHLKI